MVLEVVGGDPEVGTEEVIKASPLRVGTQVAHFSSSVAMTMGNIGMARPLRDPWYQMKGLFPAVPPATSMMVSSMYWVSREFFGSVEEAWIPDPEGIVDLQIKRGVLEPVPLQLEYPSDVANLLMLPILGDVDPTRLRLTAAESVIEEELIKGFGGNGASFGEHLAKHSTWITTSPRRSDESKKYIRHAAFEYRSKCRKLKDVVAKFEKMPSVIADKCVGFRQGFPIIFKWFRAKGLAGVSGLKEDNMTQISYLASVKAGWLPAWSPHGIKSVAYCTHRVTRQFGFDQDIPGSNLKVLGPSQVETCTKRMHDYWARIMGIFVEYVRGGTPSDIPSMVMPGLCVEPPSNFRILRNVASGNDYGSCQGTGYVEWYEEKSSWKVFGTHFPPEWASTHSSFIEDEGDREKMKKVARTYPLIFLLETSLLSGGKETSAKAVKAFAGDVDAAVDVGNTLTEEGVHVNATTGEFSTFNESNINICEPEGLTDPARGGLIVKGGTAGIVRLGAFLHTMRPSYVGLPMIRDELITHAVPTSEGVVDPNNLALILHGGTPAIDPYDDMDDNLVVREVLAPFSGEVVDTSSSSGEGIKVSPARDDDLNLTLRVPYSRLHNELSTFFDGVPFLLLKGLPSSWRIRLRRSIMTIAPDISRFQVWFGCGSGSFYLCLLSGVLCDMRRTPLELFTERKLQDWRGVARELIDLGFAVDFLLERIREVARMYFRRKASAEAETINAQITYHKEQIVQLEAKKNGLPPVVPFGNLFASCVLTHGMID
uniref:Uncharacterized protein n=1 Tax=Fagus sylvatica TaxID=28930 RepID=A0A2N9H4V3_FAGSY